MPVLYRQVVYRGVVTRLPGTLIVVYEIGGVQESGRFVEVYRGVAFLQLVRRLWRWRRRVRGRALRCFGGRGHVFRVQIQDRVIHFPDRASGRRGREQGRLLGYRGAGISVPQALDLARIQIGIVVLGAILHVYLRL